jgi:translocation and assembly module TamB
VLLLLALVAAVVLNGTYYGRERVRRLALDAVRDMVNGEVMVGRIDGNLLDRFSLLDVSITDQEGRPFLTADRVRIRVALAPLLSKRIIIRSLDLDRPVVTLSRAPGGAWNYKRIFDSGDTLPTNVRLGFGSWVDLRGITARNGTLVVHQPYPTDEVLTREIRDSAFASAMAQDTRLRIERVGSELRQTMEFRNINARIPRLVAVHPDSGAIAFRVRQLSMLAAPLQEPNVEVRNLSGDVRITDDTVTLRDADLRLTDSRIEGALTYHVSAGDVELDLKSDTLAFADIRALYPDLPERGGGRLDMKATIRDTATSEYEFRNGRLSVDGSRVAGNFGMAVNSHMLELRETDLRFTRFTTRLVESLVPGFRARVPGAFTGTAKLDGPSDAMRAVVNGTYDPARHAPFQIAANGIVGTGETIRARDLRLIIRSLPASLAREFMTEMPIGGTLSADAIITGSSASQFTGRATLTHREGRSTSTIVAEGSVAPSDSMRMRLDVRLTPVSLELIEHFAPTTDFRGDLRGAGELRGTLRDLRAKLALQLPTGTMDVDGTFDFASEIRGYEGTARLREVDLRAMVPSLPVTALNGVTTFAGRGFDPKTMDARLTMHLSEFMVDSTQVTDAVVVAAAREARVTVDTLRVRTPFASATATGAFGLDEGSDGTLTYGVDVSNLSGLQRWIATHDTSMVYPRSLVRQRLLDRAARADSLRAVSDSATLVSALATGQGRRPPARLPRIQAANSLRRDSLGGAVSVRGTLKGGLQRFTAQGKAALSGLVWDGSEIGRGTLEFTWADVQTPDVLLTAELGVDSVRVAGFAFDSTHVRGTYRAGSGDVTLAIFPGDTALYRLRARYALHADHGEVHLQDVNLRFDSLTWSSTRPSTVRWKGGGLAVDSLELRSNEAAGRGRIFVNGEVPDRDPGRLEIRIDSLRVAPWVTLLQSNMPVEGVATLHAEIEGTRSVPRIRGTVALAQPVYRKVPFPQIRSEFTYADRHLRFDGDLRRVEGGSAQLATVKGDLPIDLSFGDSVVTRMLDGLITVDLEGDSIPLGPLAELVDEFSVVTGEARGRIGMRGSWEKLRFEGAMAINIPRLGLRTPGVTLLNTIARVHMVEDRMVIDTLVAFSGGPVRASGSILLANLDRPLLDLRVVAVETRVLDNQKGQLVVSSLLDLKGPVDTLAVGGSVTVMHGVIRIPDPEEWNLINTGDPALFAVVDTALARELEIRPPSPFLKNANVDVRLQVRRGTWARSRDANIEVYGDLAIERATGDAEISVKGALHSDYGNYELYGRRFDITRGSVRFTGPPGNPVLQLLATHEVRQAGRPPLDIQVTIGGTLERPNVSLESQAQPTLTQSDLISFLAFGQSSTSLLTFEGSGLEGGGLAGSSLAGNVAALATRQLAGVALGALFTELESDLTEGTAADVVNIRPAELPAGLSLGAVGTLARGTQIEIGKYLDRNTFFVGQFRPTLAAIPGATLERRFGTQFRIRTSLETRFQPQVPSLTAGVQPKIHQVLGALLFWTRGW